MSTACYGLIVQEPSMTKNSSSSRAPEDAGVEESSVRGRGGRGVVCVWCVVCVVCVCCVVCCVFVCVRVCVSVCVWGEEGGGEGGGSPVSDGNRERTKPELGLVRPGPRMVLGGLAERGPISALSRDGEQPVAGPG